MRNIKFIKTSAVVLVTWFILIVIDILSFATWDKINYFNLILEFFVSLLVLYPFYSIQKYRRHDFYKFLNSGYYLLFVSYFVDAIDQIYIHSRFYTVFMEKSTLIVAIVLIFIGGKKWMENFQTISLTDELTQLPNRKQLLYLISKEIKISKAQASSFCFCIIDIDHFKRVNDSFGHLAGDMTLIEFSHFLQKLIKVEHIYGRWGGEEFVLLLKNTTAKAGMTILKTICNDIASHTFNIDSHSQNITASFGVAQWKNHAFEEIFIEADMALYQAKKQGRNQVVLFSAE